MRKNPVIVIRSNEFHEFINNMRFKLKNFHLQNPAKIYSSSYKTPTADGERRILQIPLTLEPGSLDGGRGNRRVGQRRRARDSGGSVLVMVRSILIRIASIGRSFGCFGRAGGFARPGERRVFLVLALELRLGSCDSTWPLLALVHCLVDEGRVRQSVLVLAVALHHLHIALVHADAAVHDDVFRHAVDLHALGEKEFRLELLELE